MITRCWRLGLLVVAALLVMPVSAGEVFAQELEPEEVAEVTLSWFSPETGEREENIKFPVPLTCLGEIECSLKGEKLEDCSGEIPKDKVGISSSSGHYIAAVDPTAIVSCKRGTSGKAILFGDLSKIEDAICFIKDTTKIEMVWKNPLWKTKDPLERAVPWDAAKEEIYCPDPLEKLVLPAEGKCDLSRYGSNTPYDLKKVCNDSGTFHWKPVASAVTSNDIIHRTTLEACTSIIGELREVCADVSGSNLDAVNAIRQERLVAIEKIKKEIMATVIGSTKCDDDCLAQWKFIQDLLGNNLRLNKDKTGFLTTPPILEKTERKALKTSLLAWIKDLEKKVSDEWGDKETLDDFILELANVDWTKADKKLDKGKQYSDKLAAAKEKGAGSQVLTSFLKKRYERMQMARSISQTKTFEVTKWLRRNKDSKETELVLFSDESKESGDINVLDRVIRLVARVLGSLAVLLLIVSAVMMIVSQGEETLLQKAKQTFLYTLIGLGISFFAYTIVRFVLELLLLR